MNLTKGRHPYLKKYIYIFQMKCDCEFDKEPARPFLKKIIIFFKWSVIVNMIKSQHPLDLAFCIPVQHSPAPPHQFTAVQNVQHLALRVDVSLMGAKKLDFQLLQTGAPRYYLSIPWSPSEELLCHKCHIIVEKFQTFSIQWKSGQCVSIKAQCVSIKACCGAPGDKHLSQPAKTQILGQHYFLPKN